jgi:hypothetical protein
MASGCEKTSRLVNDDPSTGVVRPRYRERQVLRSADLDTEQSYLIAARRRHNIGQHGWGIVQGLEILDKPKLVVQPGMAVDGYGRELIVAAPITIPNDVFTQLDDDSDQTGQVQALDIWLVYQLAEVNVPQRGSWSCGPGKNPRSREQITRVRLTPAPGHPSEVPREPIEVSDADLPFLPHRLPPDDPAREWPVYLGTIKRETEPKYDPESPRPFATLTGRVVTAPSGRGRMQVEAELQNDKRQFAVTVADSSGKLTERLGIDREGNTYITANTTVENAVDKDDPEINLNHLRFVKTDSESEGGERAGLLNFRPLAAPPAAPAPWQLYRTSVKEDNATIRQLRFEILHPGDKGEPTSYRFAIGTRNAGAFSSCFTVSANCNLTIAGEVKVGGQVVEGPIQADPTDERFGALVAQVWVAATKVGEVTATTGTITGTVTNTSGAALSGVDVLLTTTGFNTTVRTDPNGRYIASQIKLGDYTITASAPRFKSATETNQKLASFPALIVPFVLQPLAPIQCNVVDTNGVAIPNATLRFENTNTGEVVTILTNAAGVADFEPLTDGTYSVRVSASGFITKTVTAVPGNVLNIVLQRSRIQGTVQEADETPISGATIRFTHVNSGTVNNVTSGATGLFTFNAVASGTYSVRFTATGFVTQTVTAEPGDILTIIMQRPPQPTNIRGNVIDSNGAAVLAARVEFRNQNTGALSQVVTDASGNFNSGNLVPGTYEVRVTAPGFIDQIVTAAPGQIVTITLQPDPG